MFELQKRVSKGCWKQPLQQHYGFISLLLWHGIAGIAMLFSWNGAKTVMFFLCLQ